MPRALVSLVYNPLLPVLLVVGLPAFVIKGIRRGGLARNFRQRLGFYPDFLRERNGDRPLWIHAVSVGEIFLALKIIDAIRLEDPRRRIVLSTTTTTGYTVTNEREDESLTVIHNPIDIPWIAGKAIRDLNPAALLLIEAEIWPNLVAAAKRKEIPVLLLNARLSPRSARRYAKAKNWVEPIFSRLDAVTVPFQADVARWVAAGVPESRIHRLGSVKFDNASDATTGEKTAELRGWLAATGFPTGGQIVLGASTHEGEEVLLAEVIKSVRTEFSNTELVLVPRHAERGSSIASRLAAEGFDPVLRTETSGLNPVESDTQQGSVRSDGPRIWIANTTGELRAWFELAEAVVVGKSFSAEGGQNPVEPILAGKPTIVGPNMQNFSDVVADLVATEGIRQLRNETELSDAVAGVLRNPGEAGAMAARGAEAMERHRGAAARTAEFVLTRVGHS